METKMKKFFKITIPILLVLVIFASIGWYLFIYDRDFTRDMLLQGARYFDEQGNHAISGWFYDKAYEHAIEENYRFFSFGDCMFITNDEKTHTRWL